MPLLAHLEELRKRIFYAIIAVAVGFGVCWYHAEPLFAVLAEPVARYLPEGKLYYTRLMEPFVLYMKVGLLGGIFLAAPVILGQVWLFIRPGLYRRERYLAVPFIVFTTFCFLAGGTFAYLVVLPVAAGYFVSVGESFTGILTIDTLFAFESKLLLGMGLVFEMPVLVLFLARLGIVTPGFLLHYFRYAVLGIFVVAAVITPTPDMVTQTVLAVPMILLYLLSVGIAWVFQRRRPPGDADQA